MKKDMQRTFSMNADGLREMFHDISAQEIEFVDDGCGHIYSVAAVEITKEEYEQIIKKELNIAMIKHFCDICGDEIDQRTERKNKQINNLRAAEADSLAELKVLRKVVTGEMVNYRGMDICSGCANMLSDAVNAAMNDLRRTVAKHREDSCEAEESVFDDETIMNAVEAFDGV